MSVVSKKLIIALVVGLSTVLLVGGGIFFYSQKTSTSSKSPNQASDKASKTPEIIAYKLLPYEDEAGFSFDYPDNLGIIEKEVNDSSVYSSLELSSKSFPGEKITIRISDTKSKNPSGWLEANSPAGTLVTSGEITLDGMKGQDYVYAQPNRNLTIVVDSGILYYFEAPKDDNFWTKAVDEIKTSFKLVEKADTASVQTSGDASIIEEEEEIVE